MIYLAWTAASDRQKGNPDTGGRDHGTTDGVKTLCNRKVVGSDRNIEWQPRSRLACYNCFSRWLRM